MFRKKSAFDKLKSYSKKMDKKAMKMTKNLIAGSVMRKSKIYNALVKWPKRVELIATILFMVVVFFLFYKKAKDPNFLSNFNKV